MSPPDWLICNICHHPSREPYLSECCGNTFCKSCFECAKRATVIDDACPICRMEHFVAFPHKQADRTVRSLQVFCDNKEKGCNWQGELNDIINHLGNTDGCQFVEVTCSNDCGKCLQRQYLTSHVEDECVRRKVHCQYCNITGEHQFIEGEHNKQCPNFPILCPNRCSADNLPCEKLDEHQKICPLEQVSCPCNCGTIIQQQYLAMHVKTNCSALEHDSKFDSIEQQFTELQTQLLKSQEELRNKLENDVLAIRAQMHPVDIHQLAVAENEWKGTIKQLVCWCFLPSLVIIVGLFLNSYLPNNEEVIKLARHTNESLPQIQANTLKITELEMKLAWQAQQIQKIIVDLKLFRYRYMKCRHISGARDHGQKLIEQQFTKLKAQLYEELIDRIDNNMTIAREWLQQLRCSNDINQFPTEDGENKFKELHLWLFILLLVVCIGILIWLVINRITETRKRITELETELQLNSRLLLLNEWPTIIETTSSKLSLRDQVVPVIVKVTEYSKIRVNWYSNGFYTHKEGYKICLCVYPNCWPWNGYNYLSLYLMKGPYDDKLNWPLKGHCEIKLLNQISNSEHHVVKVEYNEKGHQRVTSGERGNVSMLRSLEYKYQFISRLDLQEITPTCQYLKDDSIFLQIDYRID